MQTLSTVPATRRCRQLPRLLAAGIACLLLGACTAQEAPRAARVLAPEPAMAELGDGHLARYNLLPTLSLGDAMAREYAVERRDGSALLVVAIRRQTSEGELPANAERVSARVRDLSGRMQDVALRSIRTGDYTDHVGIVATSRHDTLRIDVEAVVDGRHQRFRFERSF